MRSDDFFEHITLADEEISTARCVEQRICPFRVAGVANDLSFELAAPDSALWLKKLKPQKKMMRCFSLTARIRVDGIFGNDGAPIAT